MGNLFGGGSSVLNTGSAAGAAGASMASAAGPQMLSRSAPKDAIYKNGLPDPTGRGWLERNAGLIGNIGEGMAQAGGGQAGQPGQQAQPAPRMAAPAPMMGQMPAQSGALAQLYQQALQRQSSPQAMLGNPQMLRYLGRR